MMNDLQVLAMMAAVIESSGRAHNVNDAVSQAENIMAEAIERSFHHSRHQNNDQGETCFHCKVSKLKEDAEKRLRGLNSGPRIVGPGQ